VVDHDIEVFTIHTAVAPKTSSHRHSQYLTEQSLLSPLSLPLSLSLSFSLSASLSLSERPPRRGK